MRGSVVTLCSFGSLTLWCYSAAKENRKGKRSKFSYPTNQPALVAKKVGAVTPLAVVVTPLVWGKDYPHRGEKVKSSVRSREN
jgi:hypothetical protein